MAVADAVADHAFAERGGELGREIADLIGVRQQPPIGLGAESIIWRRARVKPSGVQRLEQVVLGEQDFVEFVRGEIFGERAHSFAEEDGGEAALGLRGDLLRGAEGFEADGIPLGFALLGDQEDVHGR